MLGSVHVADDMLGSVHVPILGLDSLVKVRVLSVAFPCVGLSNFAEYVI
jgi:hypothetical protein